MKARNSKTLSNLTHYIFENKDFFVNIGKGICKGAGALGLLYVASKMDIPVTLSPSGMSMSSSRVTNHDPIQDIKIPNIIFSKDSKDSAMISLMELGKTAPWDSYKLDYAKKIFDIAKDGTDDNTRMIAISAINAIVNTINFESSKKEAINYICKLAK